MNYAECAEILRENDDYILITHIRPDGDTLGSAAALCSALRRLGKRAYLYPNPEITPRYHKYVKDYLAPEGYEGAYTVAVDVAGEHMLAKGFEGKVKLCIDHHDSNSGYAEKLLLGSAKASCGELVLELIKLLCTEPSKTEASLLYIAVSTDCGCFRYANVTAETFAAASELANAGAEVQKLNFELFRQSTKARIMLESLICSGLRFEKNGAIVAAMVTNAMLREINATEDDCDDIAGIPGRVEGCIVSIVVRELAEGGCKASLRSQPCFDCSEVCKRFGGGGHKMASGCTLDTDPETARELLIKAVIDAWHTME